jgi:hypothetical protein
MPAKPYTAITYLLCPLCRRVTSQLRAPSESPTPTTKIGPTACNKCEAAKADVPRSRALKVQDEPDYPTRGR